MVRLADFALPFPGDGDGDLVVAVRGELFHDVVACGAVVVRLRVVEAARVPWSFGDGRVLKGVALGAVLHATILSMAFIGRASAAEEERAAFEQLARYGAVLEDRSAAAGAEIGDAPAPIAGAAAGAAPASGAPAVAGNTVARHEAGAHRPARDRAREREEASSFGLIGLLGAGTGGSDRFAAYEGPSATGNIFGATIDDAIGLGGATLSGVGEAGGGKGKGIARDGIGVGCSACMGDSRGLGGAGGRARGGWGGHVVKSPVLRCGGDLETTANGGGCSGVQVNGRLPPEAVQRVVRQGFGRLRFCYESGLRRNPGLEGRVAVKFVIDREGAVAMASAGGGDLPDAEVTACVVRGFQSMSFPPPEGGIVTVVYPLVFSS
ncbi:MAG: AgmX/PglI C-terminal domain-containing protein [Labilithrix sp.]|nr:AgmX/PglI C-terminal domain-containing protein [Labilithrix sp.]MCW5809532.1 AgmX/PglI C-terminal domain-containing protein [Labilithrix sp.]